MDQRVTEHAARDAGDEPAVLARTGTRRAGWYADDHPGWRRLERALEELARNPG